MITLSNTKFTATIYGVYDEPTGELDYKEEAYLREHIYLDFQAQTKATASVTIANNGGSIITYSNTYTTDSTGRLLVALNDVAAIILNEANYNIWTLQVTFDSSLFTILNGARVLDGVHPSNHYLPLPSVLATDTDWQGLESDGALYQMTPPNVFYISQAMPTLPLMMEMRGQWLDKGGVLASVVYIEDGEKNTLTQNSYTFDLRLAAGEVQFPVLMGVPTGATVTRFEIVDHDCNSYYFDAALLPECEEVCYLYWKSATGRYKAAIWKVRKYTEAVGSSRSLALMGDGYKQQKQTETSFSAVIEGLDAYSYAYYADIITSGEVHCWRAADIANGVEIDDDSTLVQVSGNSYTLPDGDSELRDLEVTIKYKNYVLS